MKYQHSLGSRQNGKTQPFPKPRGNESYQGKVLGTPPQNTIKSRKLSINKQPVKFKQFLVLQIRKKIDGITNFEKKQTKQFKTQDF